MIKHISVPVSALTLLVAGSLSSVNAPSPQQTLSTFNSSISPLEIAQWATHLSGDAQVLAGVDNDCGSDHTHTADCDGHISHNHADRPGNPGSLSMEQRSLAASGRKFGV